MAAIASLLAAAVAPGAALMFYVYLRDKYHSEPVRIVARLFVAGMLIVFPVMILERGALLGFGTRPWVQAYLASGLIEEFFKWFLVFFLTYSHAEFDEPYDGIVYSVAVALGFATLENIFYAFASQSLQTMLLRALLPVSGHALFGMIMGYYVGKAKFGESRRRVYLLLSFLLPFALHGTFDLLELLTRGAWAWLIVPFMLLLWWMGLNGIRRANSAPPVRKAGTGTNRL